MSDRFPAAEQQQLVADRTPPSASDMNVGAAQLASFGLKEADLFAALQTQFQLHQQQQNQQLRFAREPAHTAEPSALGAERVPKQEGDEEMVELEEPAHDQLGHGGEHHDLAHEQHDLSNEQHDLQHHLGHEQHEQHRMGHAQHEQHDLAHEQHHLPHEHHHLPHEPQDLGPEPHHLAQPDDPFELDLRSSSRSPRSPSPPAHAAADHLPDPFKAMFGQGLLLSRGDQLAAQLLKHAEHNMSSVNNNNNDNSGALDAGLFNNSPSKAGYRGELKRPDLKGQFRCTICNKIFCHSSSLSRHRMQAHFKSYTCTLCSKEITSNETLRAHMMKQHQISRMFMCRCCNWAFPDKTSLHMHMQGKADGGKGANVPVIGKGIPPLPHHHQHHPHNNNNNNNSNALAPPAAPHTPTPGMDPALFSNVLAAAQLGPHAPLRHAFPVLHPMALAAAAAAAAGLHGFNQSVIRTPTTMSTAPSPLTPSSTGSSADGSTTCANNPAAHPPTATTATNNNNPHNHNNLFAQLSTIPRDNADLFSKLRDRLFLSQLWMPGPQPPPPGLLGLHQLAQQPAGLALLSDSASNHSSDNGNEEGMSVLFGNAAAAVQQAASPVETATPASAFQNIMEMLGRQAKADLQDNNNNDANNNVGEMEVDGKVKPEPASPSLDINVDAPHCSANASPANSHTSEASSSSIECHKSKLSPDELHPHDLKEETRLTKFLQSPKSEVDQILAERNELLARRLMEIRERVMRFMDPSEASKEQLAREILHFTTLQ